jgi:amidohydrolase
VGARPLPSAVLSDDFDTVTPELIELRRDLHRHPELSFGEHRTAGIVADRLSALGLTPRTGVGGTGVTADLVGGGGPGPTLLIRADMDALPLDEVDGREYGSTEPGRMHACGHDAHTSALIGTAGFLVDRRDDLHGRVRFMFQPAEEIGLGALAMIEDGVLDGVDEAIGAHVFSPVPFGAAALRSGEFLVGADLFELAVEGGGGHSGIASQSVDAVFAAAQLVSALQSIVARETADTETLVLTIASIDGGTAANVIASTVTLRGTIRWLDREVRARALDRIEQIAAGVCSALRVTHTFTVLSTMPVLRCAEAPTTLLGEAATAAGLTVVDPGIVTASEDFANVAEKVPAGFIAVGAGGPGCGVHHAPDFDIDERAIPLTARILAGAALARLSAA